MKKNTIVKNSAAKKESKNRDYHEFSDSCFSKSICSSNDCTGLIPALPSSEAELDAYEEMYTFCLAQAPKEDENPVPNQR